MVLRGRSLREGHRATRWASRQRAESVGKPPPRIGGRGIDGPPEDSLRPKAVERSADRRRAVDSSPISTPKRSRYPRPGSATLRARGTSCTSYRTHKDTARSAPAPSWPSRAPGHVPPRGSSPILLDPAVTAHRPRSPGGRFAFGPLVLDPLLPSGRFEPCPDRPRDLHSPSSECDWPRPPGQWRLRFPFHPPTAPNTEPSEAGAWAGAAGRAGP